jgi:predicted RNA-binding Zn ribbon-like protein
MTTQAPPPLELVREFVNTLDFESGEDELSSPEALASWLDARGLRPRGAKLGPAALRRSIELREALRALLLENNGAPRQPGAIVALNEVSAQATLSVRFDADGSAELAAKDSGPGAVVAPLVTIVYGAMVNGTWGRLKVCRADDCQWAFYDRSRNRSGTWCDMAVCGNRAKVRTFRRRRSGAGS